MLGDALGLPGFAQHPASSDHHFAPAGGRTGEHQRVEQPVGRDAEELAEAIRSDGRDSDRVHAAIRKIHSNMGELQMFTIGHVFEMKEVLSPEQYQKLLNFTADALDNLDCPHGAE